jgi:uncharacterized protein (DUF1501 family)
MKSVPNGMSRRHFMKHMAGSAAMAGTAMSFVDTLRANADTLKKNNKAAILCWWGGGASTMDMWDLKPGAATGGPFKNIATKGEFEICEHLPMLAKVADKFSVVRSMSTREADHDRGRYYMHTGYVPNPAITHPSYGSVISHELGDQVPDLAIPPFISIGGASVGPGFLGMAYAPLVVGSNGQVRNLQMDVDNNRLMQRMHMLREVESGFIKQNRGETSQEHAKILQKTLDLMTSEQMVAFQVAKESAEVKERYGAGFGQSLLLARRLVEAGVSFCEADYGGWDNHANIFPTLSDTKLPMVDQAISALIEDLDARGRLKDTVVIAMGEFSRTPRINGDTGRDHWARSWSVMVGGGGIKPGVAVGKTNAEGTSVETDPYSAEDLMATVCQALNISLKTTFTSKNGRPMKIANGGKVINELFS